MQRLRWLTLVWPGLPQLWFAGAWSGLAMAGGFAALLNLALVCSRLWTELLSPQVQGLIWTVTGMAWLGAAAVSVRWVAGLNLTGRFADDEGLFNLARSEYLMGNWFEAETILDRLLARNVLDVEARLMLATLLRHTERFEEAGEHLSRLSRIDGAERWQLEIGRQKARLADQMRAAAEKSDEVDEDQDDAADEEQLSQAA